MPDEQTDDGSQTQDKLPTRGRAKRWAFSDDVFIAGDPNNKTITLYAGDAAIELDGESGEISLIGSLSKMSGGAERDEVIFQQQMLPLRLIPSSMATPLPTHTFTLPFEKIGGLVGDVAMMIGMMF